MPEVRLQQFEHVGIEIDLAEQRLEVRLREAGSGAISQTVLRGPDISPGFLEELFNKPREALTNSQRSVQFFTDGRRMIVGDLPHAIPEAARGTNPKPRQRDTDARRRITKASRSESVQREGSKEPVLRGLKRLEGRSGPRLLSGGRRSRSASQVNWLQRQLGMGDRFFARFLPADEGSFRGWREHRKALSLQQQEDLGKLWVTVLHLLSFSNFDVRRLRILLDREIPFQSSGGRNSLLLPAWKGSSMRAYLEERGTTVLAEIDSWVTAFPFWRSLRRLTGGLLMPVVPGLARQSLQDGPTTESRRTTYLTRRASLHKKVVNGEGGVKSRHGIRDITIPVREQCTSPRTSQPASPKRCSTSIERSCRKSIARISPALFPSSSGDSSSGNSSSRTRLRMSSS